MDAVSALQSRPAVRHEAPSSGICFSNLKLNPDVEYFLYIGELKNDVVAEGAFLGRIVALGHDHESVRQGLRQGRKTLELTINRHSEAFAGSRT